MVEIAMLTELQEIKEVIQHFNNLGMKTPYQKELLIKRIQELNEKLKNKPEIVNTLNKIYPLLDEKGKYTGRYFEIMIMWTSASLLVDRIREGRDLDKIYLDNKKFKELTNDLKKRYLISITEVKNERIKRNLEKGLKNLERYIKYAEALTAIKEGELKSSEIKEILKRNKDIFWTTITEKKNVFIRKAAERIENEIKELKNNVIEKNDLDKLVLINKVANAVNEIKRIM